VLAVCCALAAFLTKTIGVAVVAAALGALLIRSRWRWAAVGTAASGLVTGTWLYYIRRAAESTIGNSYLRDLSVGYPSETAFGPTGRILRNTRYYLEEGLPELLALFMVPSSRLDNLVWAVVLVSAGLAGTIWLVRRWPMAALALPGMAFILLLWPWGITRLAIPLIPLGITGIVIGAMVGGRHLGGPRVGRAASVAIVMALGLSVPIRLHRDSTWMRQCPRPDPYVAASPCTSPMERALVAGARRAEAHLPAVAVIATTKPPVVYWFSERRTVPLRLLGTATASTLVAEMRRVGATHMLLARMHPVEYRDLAAAFEGACQDLTEAAAVPGPAVLLAPRTAGEPDACAAIRAVLSWSPPAP
jgi:hypothetical protein